MNLYLHKTLKALIRKAGETMSPRPQTPPLIGSPDRVAYFIGGGIGDAIMAYPALRLLKRHLPTATIHVFVPEKKHLLLTALFDDFIIDALSPVIIASLLSRRVFRRYDVAFTNLIACFKADIEIIARACSRRTFGFRYPDETPEERIFDFSLPIARTLHDIDQNIELVRAPLGLTILEEDRQFPRTERPWHRNGPPVVLIHPGAELGYPHKLWPLENYRQVVQRLSNESCRVTVIIGPAEDEAYSVLKYIPGVDFLVRPDPQTLVHEFKRADLFVGNDSGPAHIAAFYGIPGVTLIGPVDPSRTAPRSPEGVFIYSKENCSPCHFSDSPCSNNSCMKNITVERAWEAIARMLKNGLLR